MVKELLQQKDLPWLEESTILLVDSGSTAYGTNLPTSDKDYKGICIPPIDYLLGLKNFEQYQPTGNDGRKNTAEDIDVTVYGLKKFFKLAMNGNPNVLEMLFVDKENIAYCTEEGKVLLENRELFLTNKIKNSIGGYAYQQSKNLVNGKSTRPELEDMYGYDTKKFMHSVRLYEMGMECFKEGTMRTKRPNAEELKDIRKGKYTAKEAVEMLEHLNNEYQKASENSVLPNKPNDKTLNKLLIDLHLTKL